MTDVAGTDWAAVRAFILARLAEEEADARAAAGAHPSATWIAGRGFGDEGVIDDPDGDPVALWAYVDAEDQLVGLSAADVGHIARQGPAATLARVVALRGLVGLHWSVIGNGENDDDRTLAKVTLLCVAAFWSDHADFQPEWVLSD